MNNTAEILAEMKLFFGKGDVTATLTVIPPDLAEK